MKASFKVGLCALAIQSALVGQAIAEEQAESQPMETITIIGSAAAVNDIPGSANVVTQDQLEAFDYSDVMRVLAQVPGVYVMEEDGYGLRPNIGMRGTGTSRSEKITVMEDGVLVAPAPLAAPAAYYFPTMGRMTGVEVLKGSSAVRHGPRTTGGVLNLISRQIPDDGRDVFADVAIGENNYGKIHAAAAGNKDNIGALLEVYRYQADGFKKLPVNKDTGFVKNDVMFKLKGRSLPGASTYQETELKYKYSDEESDETYMGLTDADFANSPYARYAASQNDKMKTDHHNAQINHFARFSGGTELSSQVYYNKFARNWYKAYKVNGDSLGSGGIDAASAFDKNPTAEGLSVDIKANNREYYSYGIQTEAVMPMGDHNFIIGGRYHYDQMDRFQWADNWMLNQDLSMTLVNAGEPGTDSNRIDSGRTAAGYAQGEFVFGDLQVNAGARYQWVELRRKDWGKTNPSRQGSPDKDVKNTVQAVLPAIGLTYRATDDLVILAGVQKGFAPPAPGNDSAKAEESINYEAGLRYNMGSIGIDAIGFFSDYSNMHGNCTAAQGCDEEKIDNQYNAGEVEIKGLELSANYTADLGAVDMPLRLAYTLTDSQFKNDFESDLDTWGSVKKGDELPYLAKHQLYLRAGLEGNNWTFNVNARYLSDMRTQAGQGTIPADRLIPSRWVMDLGANYRIGEQHKIYLNVDNLTNKVYAATRVHGSLQPGKPRTAILGYRYSF
ncbi:TonB-dependent receptor family protein [Paraferrimonas sedimenticola]|uniref:TonB-dependent receptor n=1 Tax=Paraferrimonas sedimenticola TaxID=375674 RepID=A0AA37W1U1_9GAMM|nr:TonB-dependent receptor [Paraferrimonas sedimenticola]GLP96792.1 TonB-dependent receptor [Paraferrimonas sedimenticola]